MWLCLPKMAVTLGLSSLAGRADSALGTCFDCSSPPVCVGRPRTHAKVITGRTTRLPMCQLMSVGVDVSDCIIDRFLSYLGCTQARS